jgi:hypothetical protein
MTGAGSANETACMWKRAATAVTASCVPVLAHGADTGTSTGCCRRCTGWRSDPTPGGAACPGGAAPVSSPGTKKPTPITELAPAPLPVWLCPRLLRLRLRQAVALVLYVDGDLGQRLGVLAAVVRAEKQFP